MRVIDKRVKLSRRGVLSAGSASLVVMTVASSGMIVGADSAWAAMAKAVKPESFATLVQMARDIYPHDRLAGIGAKTLLCGGRYDGIAKPANMENLNERIPDSTLAWFEGGHGFMLEDRAAFPRIVEFLTGD